MLFINIFHTVIYILGSLWLKGHSGLLLCPDMKSIFGTGNSNIPSLWNWKMTHTRVHALVLVSWPAAHLASSHLIRGRVAMGSAEITLGRLLRPAWTHFPNSSPAGNVTLCDVQRRRLSNNSATGYLKRPPCVSVTPGFCFLRALPGPRAFPLSAAHVERWYVWILNGTPQRIPN